MPRADLATSDSLSAVSAVDEVWGPARLCLSLATVVAGGCAGWGLAAVAPPGEESSALSREAFRTWACVGYGIACGGFLTLLPRLLSLVRLGRGLSRRPSADEADWPWWPLTLVASALRDTPALRRTPEDFRSAVTGFVPQARGLLAQRLWPACAAAFTAPVLGLISAWLSWQAYLPERLRQAQERAQPGESVVIVPDVDWGSVAVPMIGTIALSLVLMLGIVIVDQLTMRLLQRWAGSVRALDAESPLVQERLATGGEFPVRDASAPVRPVRSALEPARPPESVRAQPPPPPPEPEPEPQISAQELEGLGELFKNG
jgi:hypothetical protein